MMTAGHHTMYFANGLMLAAWDIPGGVRPTQRWQLNINELLASYGMAEETESISFGRNGLYTVSEQVLGQSKHVATANAILGPFSMHAIQSNPILPEVQKCLLMGAWCPPHPSH